MDIKQQVVNHSRKPFVTSRVVNLTQIRDSVSNNPYQQLGWNRVGSIVIPDFNVSLPIYNQPYNQSALKIGAQELKLNNDEPGSNIGHANLTLVAHNYNDGKTEFSPLQKSVNQDAPYLVNGQTKETHWADGKKIYVANQEGIYEYSISSQFAVRKTDTGVLKSSTNQINIITCLFPSDDYRIVTHAEFIKEYKWSNAPVNIVSYFDSTINKQNT